MRCKLSHPCFVNYKVYQIDVGDILSYGKLEAGFRAYLAIKGGFKSKLMYGSSSFYKPVTFGNRLMDGDMVRFDYNEIFKPKISEIKVDSFLGETVLKVHKAPEFDILTETQLELLFSKDFIVAKENNRMAYQLNELLEGHTHNMLTSATLPGTVQLTPAGKLIILMKDGQTTGGYPRILQLSDKAIAILAQKREGATISFKLV